MVTKQSYGAAYGDPGEARSGGHAVPVKVECGGIVRRITPILLLTVFLAACVADGDSLGTADGLQSAAVPGASAGGLRVVRDLPPPPTAQDGSLQRIGPNDVLEIDVFQVNELDRTVQVDSSGKIAMPLIGEVEAAGQSPRGLEQKLKAAYGRNYLESPQISVRVTESFSQRVVVDGEVNKAGIFPVTANSTLLSTVSQAGGLARIADQSKVYVYRDYGNEKLVAQYSVKDIRRAQDPDPRIYGGDVVVVFASGARVAMQNLMDVTGLATRAAIFVP